MYKVILQANATIVNYIPKMLTQASQLPHHDCNASATMACASFWDEPPLPSSNDIKDYHEGASDMEVHFRGRAYQSIVSGERLKSAKDAAPELLEEWDKGDSKCRILIYQAVNVDQRKYISYN